MRTRKTVDEKIAEAIQSGATHLNLSGARLTSLPKEIGELSQLRTINLSANNLNSLSDNINQLKNLNSIDLRWNQLVSLPKGISELPKLRSIDLSGNKTPSIHKVILSTAALPNLKVLVLRENGINSLPESIANLTHLRSLDLSNNELTSLPNGITKLKRLEILKLRDNSLVALPDDFSKFPRLGWLDLRNNPLPIPAEVLKNCSRASQILHYISDLEGSRNAADPRYRLRQLNEAKVILVGEAKNGKTSLAKRLMGKEFNPIEPKTDGIDILQWTIKAGDRTIRLNVWDLGGQEIYHATHQFFLTERTLYILVLNSRQSDSQNRLDYWLKTIRTLGKEAPIFIVQNQYEQNPQELNRKLLKEKYPSIQGFFQTSCADPTLGIETLTNAIAEAISLMPHVSDLLPGSYFHVKEQLEVSDKDFMPYVEYEAFCQKEGLTDPKSQQVLIRLLHELGTVLNFDDFRLKDTNVLNPEWVTDGVYKILDHMPIRTAGDAVLRPRILKEILPPNRYPRDKQRFIVDMMEKFELCFLREGREEYLIPELLAPGEPEDTGDFEDALRLEYHYDFLPASVLPRFIVRTHHLRQTYYWRDGVVLEDGRNYARVRADIEDKRIRIEISGLTNTRRDLLAKIRDQFAYIHHTLQGMVAEEMIPIPGYPQAKPVPYAFLIELERDRETSFRWEGIPSRLVVANLLNGIESKRTRSSERIKLNRKAEADLINHERYETEIQLGFFRENEELPPHLFGALQRSVQLVRRYKEKPMIDIEEELKRIDGILKVSEDNERYLKQLARHVSHGKVVPFVGAGMSMPVGMKSWTVALESIYGQAEASLKASQARSFGDAQARGALEEAAQVLWDAMGEKWFNDRIRALFGRDVLSRSKLKDAPISLLPRFAKGPVLTTNFDTVLEQVYGNFKQERDIILGDYRADSILDRWDDRQHFLLKLHGDADESAGRVLTQRQYDRAYDESASKLPILLRQLFNSRRPLLFLGCSLGTDRTIQELQKAGLQMHNAYHFALLKDPGSETSRRRRQNDLVAQLGIQPIWLATHDEIRMVLNFLAVVQNS